MLDPAVLGVLVHYPAYRFGGFCYADLRDAEDIVSTIKIISAMLLFPLTWIILALVIYKFHELASGFACTRVDAGWQVTWRFVLNEELDASSW